MTLVRVGGKDDFGIDLIGTWAPPSAPAPLKVLVQCKALAKKASPALVRELEGAFVGAPSGWRGEKGVLGFLVAKKECTKGVRDALGRSLCPLGYVACDDNGRVKQMLWNRRAEEGGLLGLGVELKHFGKEDEKEIVLTWKDHVYG